MNMSNSKLLLGPLPKTETVKLTVALLVTLKSDLGHYAMLHMHRHTAILSMPRH